MVHLCCREGKRRREGGGGLGLGRGELNQRGCMFGGCLGWLLLPLVPRHLSSPAVIALVWCPQVSCAAHAERHFTPGGGSCYSHGVVTAVLRLLHLHLHGARQPHTAAHVGGALRAFCFPAPSPIVPAGAPQWLRCVCVPVSVCHACMGACACVSLWAVVHVSPLAGTGAPCVAWMCA